jgi:hypothetical protein
MVREASQQPAAKAVVAHCFGGLSETRQRRFNEVCLKSHTTRDFNPLTVDPAIVLGK